jgi:geranylgeranyl transferase type-1 subunit beta
MSGTFKVQTKCPSFSSEPLGGDSDLRTTFCAFAISTMLDDWSGMDVASALQFIRSCRVSLRQLFYREPL